MTRPAPSRPPRRRGGRLRTAARRNGVGSGRPLPVRAVPHVRHPPAARRHHELVPARGGSPWRATASSSPGRRTALRRAELEGQIPRLVAEPALLASWRRPIERRRPDAADAGGDPPRQATPAPGGRASRGRADRQDGGDMAAVSGFSGPVRGRGPPASSWWFPPIALGRVAALLRLLAYAFVPVDVLVTDAWVGEHGDVPAVLYRPVMVARLLHLPPPTRLSVDLVRIGAARRGVVALVRRPDPCHPPRPGVGCGRVRPVRLVDARRHVLRQGGPRPVRATSSCWRCSRPWAPRHSASSGGQLPRRLGRPDDPDGGRGDVLPGRVEQAALRRAGTGPRVRR